MEDTTTSKRVLPPRERRESAAKRRGSSPFPSPKTATPNKKPALTKTTPKSLFGTKNAKKRAAAEATPPRRPSTPIVPEEILPTKLSDAKPLPTSRVPQPEHLSTKDYQSLAESAVLTASLHRSRMKWLCEGIFERYWTKPSKKKGAPEVASNNPDQKSMQRLGTCSITIEPHTFDATVWIVRDPQGPLPVHYRHPNQYPQPSPAPPGPPAPPAFQNYYSNGPQQQPQPQPNLQARPPYPPPTRLDTGDLGPHAVKQENTSPSAISPAAESSNRKSSVGGPPGLPIPAAPATPFQLSHSPSKPLATSFAPPPPTTGSVPATPNSAASPAKPNTDPVIQMLATRAATDPELKALMKVVASSKASQEQLKLFQSHIDELNGIIRRQEAEKAERDREMHHRNGVSTPSSKQPSSQINGLRDEYTSSRPNAPLYPPGVNTTPSNAHNVPPSYGPGISKHGPALPAHAGHAPLPPMRTTGAKVGPLGPAIPYASFPPPSPRVEPRIKHIVIEFTTPASSTQAASQDRWLFPEYAVLDTPISGRGLEMVCSFFVERKGSQIRAVLDEESAKTGVIADQKWKADDDYYQAVTMTLKAPQHRTLETIARAAKPLLEVQKYMREVMEKKKRAPEERLVMQLPKEKISADEGDVLVMEAGTIVWKEDFGEFIDSGVEVGSGDEDDELQDYYGV